MKLAFLLPFWVFTTTLMSCGSGEKDDPSAQASNREVKPGISREIHIRLQSLKSTPGNPRFLKVDDDDIDHLTDLLKQDLQRVKPTEKPVNPKVAEALKAAAARKADGADGTEETPAEPKMDSTPAVAKSDSETSKTEITPTGPKDDDPGPETPAATEEKPESKPVAKTESKREPPAEAKTSKTTTPPPDGFPEEIEESENGTVLKWNGGEELWVSVDPVPMMQIDDAAAKKSVCWMMTDTARRETPPAIPEGWAFFPYAGKLAIAPNGVGTKLAELPVKKSTGKKESPPVEGTPEKKTVAAADTAPGGKEDAGQAPKTDMPEHKTTTVASVEENKSPPPSPKSKAAPAPEPEPETPKTHPNGRPINFAASYEFTPGGVSTIHMDWRQKAHGWVSRGPIKNAVYASSFRDIHIGEEKIPEDYRYTVVDEKYLVAIPESSTTPGLEAILPPGGQSAVGGVTTPGPAGAITKNEITVQFPDSGKTAAKLPEAKPDGNAEPGAGNVETGKAESDPPAGTRDKPAVHRPEDESAKPDTTASQPADQPVPGPPIPGNNAGANPGGSTSAPRPATVEASPPPAPPRAMGSPTYGSGPTRVDQLPGGKSPLDHKNQRSAGAGTFGRSSGQKSTSRANKRSWQHPLTAIWNRFHNPERKVEKAEEKARKAAARAQESEAKADPNFIEARN